LPGLLQQHDVAGELLGEIFVAHGVAAVFHDDGFVVVLLHVRQRLRQDAGLILRAVFDAAQMKSHGSAKSLRPISTKSGAAASVIRQVPLSRAAHPWPGRSRP
jgi:hypothetical protein